jgi:hypothetical protein
MHFPAGSGRAGRAAAALKTESSRRATALDPQTVTVLRPSQMAVQVA